MLADKYTDGATIARVVGEFCDTQKRGRHDAADDGDVSILDIPGDMAVG